MRKWILGGIVGENRSQSFCLAERHKARTSLVKHAVAPESVQETTMFGLAFGICAKRPTQ
jgi:hypothetical protein